MRYVFRTAPAAFWSSWADTIHIIDQHYSTVSRAIVGRLTGGDDQGCLGVLVGATKNIDRDGFMMRPSWEELQGGMRPPSAWLAKSRVFHSEFVCGFVRVGSCVWVRAWGFAWGVGGGGLCVGVCGGLCVWWCLLGCVCGGLCVCGGVFGCACVCVRVCAGWGEGGGGGREGEGEEGEERRVFVSVCVGGVEGCFCVWVYVCICVRVWVGVCVYVCTCRVWVFVCCGEEELVRGVHTLVARVVQVYHRLHVVEEEEMGRKVEQEVERKNQSEKKTHTH